MIDKAHLELELMDARSQRDQAQQQLAQANQAAQIANTNIVGCSFVEKQLLALIAKLDKDAENEKLATAPTPEPDAPVVLKRRRRRSRAASANGSAPSEPVSHGIGQAGGNSLAHTLAIAGANAGSRNPLA